MDRDMGDHNCIYTDADLPPGDVLAGNWVVIANDNAQDACYEIKSVRRENGRTALDLGDITFIRSVKDPRDYSAGYSYNFEVGQSFTIPAWTWLRKLPDGTRQARSNVGGGIEVAGHSVPVP